MDEERPLPRAMSRRALVTAGLAATASAALGAHWWLDAGSSHPDRVVEGFASVGAPAPRFTLEQLWDSRSISLPRIGEPLLLSFSATWCLTCVAELRNFQAVHRSFSGSPSIAAVNFQQSRSTIRSLVDRLDVPDVSILLDSTGAVTRAYRVNALPAMALIDSNGIVRALSNEYLSVQRIAELLAEVGATPTR